MRARRNRNVRIPLAAAFVLLGIASAQPAVSQILWTAYELGALCDEGISFALDSAGISQAVGRSGYVTDSDTRAVRWTYLGVESLGTLPGGDYSAAYGMNLSGQVVGTSNTATVVRAFLWTSASGMQDLGTLPGNTGSEASDINNASQVAGTSSGPIGIRAVRWRSDRTIDNLGTLPGGNFSRADALNDSGQVVGTSGSPSGPRAFLWTASGGMTDLGTLPGDTESEAAAINGLGHVVGYSSGPAGTRAFLWTSGGGMQNLGTLPGGDYSKAYSINDLGQVVGTSTDSSGTTRAFFWTGVIGMLDLNGLIPVLDGGLILSEAHHINNLGLVTTLSGQVANPDDHDHEHFYRVFLLQP
jgi:probable HAF family extracellular repeat protein